MHILDQCKCLNVVDRCQIKGPQINTMTQHLTFIDNVITFTRQLRSEHLDCPKSSH